jgi:hypothetical protein
MVLRLLIRQPEDKQRAIVFNTSYNRSLQLTFRRATENRRMQMPLLDSLHACV